MRQLPVLVNKQSCFNQEGLIFKFITYSQTPKEHFTFLTAHIMCWLANIVQCICPCTLIICSKTTISMYCRCLSSEMANHGHNPNTSTSTSTSTIQRKQAIENSDPTKICPDKQIAALYLNQPKLTVSQNALRYMYRCNNTLIQ